jgi:exo-beta-1,3-glucanase (GH17 family)
MSGRRERRHDVPPGYWDQSPSPSSSIRNAPISPLTSYGRPILDAAGAAAVPAQPANPASPVRLHRTAAQPYDLLEDSPYHLRGSSPGGSLESPYHLRNSPTSERRARSPRKKAGGKDFEARKERRHSESPTKRHHRRRPSEDPRAEEHSTEYSTPQEWPSKERAGSPQKKRREGSASPTKKHRRRPSAAEGYGGSHVETGSIVTGRSVLDRALAFEAGLGLDDFGKQALRDIDNLFGGGRMMMMNRSPSPGPYEQEAQSRLEYPTPEPHPPSAYIALSSPPRVPFHRAANSASSITPLMMRPGTGTGTPTPRDVAPIRMSPALTPRGSYYQGDGYDESFVNPDEIADDGDEMFEDLQRQPIRESRSIPVFPAVAAAGAGAGTGFLKAFGGRSEVQSAKYGSVPCGGSSVEIGRDAEKSEWLQDQSNSKKRWAWIIGSIFVVIVLAAIIGGSVGGALANKKTSSKSSSNDGAASSSSSTSSGSGHGNGDSSGLFDINSSQVKQLLNNTALHRVFPGMDYTPLNAQYPDCLTNPPDQNNITLDLAILAQLTPAVRLYGTDCNQTEMVLTAINRLGYNETLKVWLGVWLENNATTNTRQLQQMYDILNTYPSSHFAGVIVGNEVLFRKDLTESALGDQLQSVRSNLTAKKIDLPVATSDLGDDWTSALAADTDIVMANVHPFFAGVGPEEASGWTWTFWQENDVVLTTNETSQGSGSGSYPKNIIAETGWPSAGGNDCGTQSGSCPNATAGAVASIDNMNTFMEGWVCEALTNGTTYFW